MIKLSCTLATLLLCISAAFGQSRTSKDLSIDYDKFKDETTVSVSDLSTLPSLYATFTYKGESLQNDVDRFYFGFTSKYCSGFCFRGTVGLRAIVDGGSPLLLAERRDVLSDDIVFGVDRPMIESLASAQKQVEFQVGFYNCVWKPKAIAKIRALLEAGTIKK